MGSTKSFQDKKHKTEKQCIYMNRWKEFWHKIPGLICSDGQDDNATLRKYMYT